MPISTFRPSAIQSSCQTTEFSNNYFIQVDQPNLRIRLRKPTQDFNAASRESISRFLIHSRIKDFKLLSLWEMSVTFSTTSRRKNRTYVRNIFSNIKAAADQVNEDSDDLPTYWISEHSRDVSFSEWDVCKERALNLTISFDSDATVP